MESGQAGFRPDISGFPLRSNRLNKPCPYSGARILFDTGSDGRILLGNMEKLDIDPCSISEVFISHSHGDHTGGLSGFLDVNKDAKVYVPSSFHFKGEGVISVKESIEIHPNIYSTGELSGIEQSLAVKTEKGIVVIAGCSHSGVSNILKEASGFGKVYALIGGLHGFREFDILKGLDLICACHCTQYQREIKDLYPNKWVEGGVGKEIELK
ncbi:MBL fold metallo-hydrolase [candidate division WOR-3 bacterium]|nr:MBL fold metallo-hydrolase [candidate division WOR-3 bacterium]